MWAPSGSPPVGGRKCHSHTLLSPLSPWALREVRRGRRIGAGTAENEGGRQASGGGGDVQAYHAVGTVTRTNVQHVCSRAHTCRVTVLEAWVPRGPAEPALRCPNSPSASADSQPCLTDMLPNYLPATSHGFAPLSIYGADRTAPFKTTN